MGRIITVIVELLILVGIGYFTTGVTIATLARRGLLKTKLKRSILQFAGLALSALCLYNGVATAVLALLLVSNVFLYWKLRKQGKENLAYTITRILGIPATVAIIINTVVLLKNNHGPKSLLWFVGPLIFFLALSNTGRESGKNKNYDFVLPLAVTVVFTAVIVATIVFANSKGVI